MAEAFNSKHRTKFMIMLSLCVLFSKVEAAFVVGRRHFGMLVSVSLEIPFEHSFFFP